jgi:hypothetical protein
MIICSNEFISSDANLRNTRAVGQNRIHPSTRHRKLKMERKRKRLFMQKLNSIIPTSDPHLYRR